MMKKLILIIVTVFSFSVLADAHTESAENLLEALKIDESLEVTVEGFRPAMLSQYAQFVDPNNGDEATLAVSYSYIQRKILIDFYQSEKVRGAIISVYMDSFTQEELDNLVRFYQTPLGQKMVKESTVIQQKMQPIMMNEAKSIQPLVQELISDFKKEIQRMRDSNR
ncbi:DUF2059 domain-containing protein [Photobacterium sp. GJ3]|uniref:DUF2059 domain-containing protein n=1 Tax=Photobacterium sp. GJ3 TaxID=2829502 RepID=UPI001B8C875A|nr:DUF2059 domain-containing protein [Photobacterium sp. GJ3]QUJ67515.1 DUF2059 domain-containing protein [Photobacterium sp. GJ3]